MSSSEIITTKTLIDDNGKEYLVKYHGRDEIENELMFSISDWTNLRGIMFYVHPSTGKILRTFQDVPFTKVEAILIKDCGFKVSDVLIEDTTV